MSLSETGKRTIETMVIASAAARERMEDIENELENILYLEGINGTNVVLYNRATEGPGPIIPIVLPADYSEQRLESVKERIKTQLMSFLKTACYTDYPSLSPWHLTTQYEEYEAYNAAKQAAVAQDEAEQIVEAQPSVDGR